MQQQEMQNNDMVLKAGSETSEWKPLGKEAGPLVRSSPSLVMDSSLMGLLFLGFKKLNSVIDLKFHSGKLIFCIKCCM